MTDPSPSPEQPNWVTKRDGKLVPFEADKISRSLFAATESCGAPDPFLARELTDGILHFLPSETAGIVPTTAWVKETVIKVVRELGQPVLAKTYGAFSRQENEMAGGSRRRKFHADDLPQIPKPGDPGYMGPTYSGPPISEFAAELHPGKAAFRFARLAGKKRMREFSLKEVYSRDLVAAHRTGLLVLTGLETPVEMEGLVLSQSLEGSERIAESIEKAREIVGNWLAFDSPEYSIDQLPGKQNKLLENFIRDVELGLRFTELRGIVNLNCSIPPQGAIHLAGGPLFENKDDIPKQEITSDLADRLAALWFELGMESSRIRIDWHLRDRDFETENQKPLLARARHVLDGHPLSFVFDRPRQQIPLAEGLDRAHTALMAVTGINLLVLSQQPGVKGNPGLFLKKLGSLARLAISSGVQKRDFLRRQMDKRPELAQGFLLDRAHLIVVPVGLDAAIRNLMERNLSDEGPGLVMAQEIVAELNQVFKLNSRNSHLISRLDSALEFSLGNETVPEISLDRVAGLTPWESLASPKVQLKSAGMLHAIGGNGTAALLIPSSAPISPEKLVDILQFTWEKTETSRLRLIRISETK